MNKITDLESRKLKADFYSNPDATLDLKCKAIEDLLHKLACACKDANEQIEIDNKKKWNILHVLVAERKDARTRGKKVRTKELSKQIQREVRTVNRGIKKERIERVLREFKGIKQIAGIKQGDT